MILSKEEFMQKFVLNALHTNANFLRVSLNVVKTAEKAYNEIKLSCKFESKNCGSG